jgi:hypothetical protein
MVGDYFLWGKAYGANIGWIDLGSGAPANGIRYGNASRTDFGINHDSSGNLTGYAYGANVGWINFSWATPTDGNRPRIDPMTGTWSGYAYSANIGWISLAGNLQTLRVARVDTDRDGISDAWEREHFGNLSSAKSTSDKDGDGVTDLNEFIAGTNPTDRNEFLKVLHFDALLPINQAVIEFSSKPSTYYRVDSSVDLVNWSQGPVERGATGATTTRTISWGAELGSTARRFFRVHALKPLQN